MQDTLADGAEKQTGEAAVTAGSDHDEVRGLPAASSSRAGAPVISLVSTSTPGWPAIAPARDSVTSDREAFSISAGSNTKNPRPPLYGIGGVCQACTATTRDPVASA